MTSEGKHSYLQGAANRPQRMGEAEWDVRSKRMLQGKLPGWISKWSCHKDAVRDAAGKEVAGTRQGWRK